MWQEGPCCLRYQEKFKRSCAFLNLLLLQRFCRNTTLNIVRHSSHPLNEHFAFGIQNQHIKTRITRLLLPDCCHLRFLPEPVKKLKYCWNYEPYIPFSSVEKIFYFLWWIKLCNLFYTIIFKKLLQMLMAMCLKDVLCQSVSQLFWRSTWLKTLLFISLRIFYLFKSHSVKKLRE